MGFGPVISQKCYCPWMEQTILPYPPQNSQILLARNESKTLTPLGGNRTKLQVCTEHWSWQPHKPDEFSNSHCASEVKQTALEPNTISSPSTRDTQEKLAVPLRGSATRVNTFRLSCCCWGQRQTGTRLSTAQIIGYKTGEKMSNTSGYSRLAEQGEQTNPDSYVWKNTSSPNRCKIPHDGPTLAWVFWAWIWASQALAPPKFAAVFSLDIPAWWVLAEPSPLLSVSGPPQLCGWQANTRTAHSAWTTSSS